MQHRTRIPGRGEIATIFAQAFKHHQEGWLGKAREGYQSILHVLPEHPDALHLLGVVFYQQGSPQEAIRYIDDALRYESRVPEYHNNRANALKALGRYSEAIASFESALALNPQAREVVLLNLGECQRLAGDHLNAERSLRAALAINPDHVQSILTLGSVLMEISRTEEAESLYRQATKLCPTVMEAHDNLANALVLLGRVHEAEQSYLTASQLNTRHPTPRFNLANLFRDVGRQKDAVQEYRTALVLDPTNQPAWSNLLFTLNYDAEASGEEIYKAYREFDRRFGEPLRSTWRAHAPREAGRRLKIGYVSPDFKRHVVRHFIEPVLAHHDHSQFEVYAYAEVKQEDEVTTWFRGHVDHWVPTVGLSDEAMAERIREDGIDILIELAGHTSGNRLLVLARKPAPVTVSWLGYGYTTGLTAIDYLLTDEVCCPPGSEHLFAERPWRLGVPNFVYRAPEGMGGVSLLPALEKGYVTFGTLTRAVRINEHSIRVWSEILKRVEGARLVLDSNNFRDAELQETMAARFVSHGVSRDQLLIGYHSPPWDLLRTIDITLDCFPHNSGTTLFESLYMGIPYITLAGRPSVGRLGSSILTGLGHTEWIATSEQEYIDKAVALAADLATLSRVRATLRDEMKSSPLMNELAFTRKLEAAFRGMCSAGSSTGNLTALGQ